MGETVLLLGDPRLWMVSSPVAGVAEPAFKAEVRRLQAVLEAFRLRRGFGRGIAAPQIGIPLRFIVLNLGAGPLTMVNPVITWRSAETFTLWDDCMCFPDLLVRVRRNLSISLAFQDESGRFHTWEAVGQVESELLQHEIDHLDGVLATDRALDGRSLVYRRAFDADPDFFRSQVDYRIEPLAELVPSPTGS